MKKNSRYSTTGPASIFDIMTPKPDQPAPECYVDAVPLTKRCNEAQLAALIAGTAVVRNGIVVSPA